MSLYIMIKIDESYKLFLVEEKTLVNDSPLSDYYYKLDDLSINIIITFKWILWGYKFLKDISNELIENKEELSELISKSNQKNNNLINEIKYLDHIIILDDKIIKDDNHFNFLIKNFYKNELFNNNTKIHFKLKMNLNDYLLLTNELYPTLVKLKI